MSLIAYSRGMLVADNIAEIDLAGVSFHTTMQKLHVSDSKFFAFAYCGKRIMDRNIRKVLDVIHAMLVKHLMGGRVDPLEIPSEYEALMEDRGIIIMTCDQVFDRMHGAANVFTEIDLSGWAGHGTYLAAFSAANVHAAQRDDPTDVAADRAVRFAAGRDCCISAIKQSGLVPIPIEEPKKEEVTES